MERKLIIKMNLKSFFSIIQKYDLDDIISIDETPAGQRFYWGEQEIDISQISSAVKRNPEWKVFLRVHPQVTHSVVQDALKEIGNGGQADVIFATFKSGN